MAGVGRAGDYVMNFYYKEMILIRGFNCIAIGKGFKISMKGYLTIMMHKFDALMICRWNDLHDMNPWATKEDVIWKVKINYMVECFLSGRADSNREKDGSFSSALQIVIFLDGDHFIDDICFSISYLFDEL